MEINAIPVIVTFPLPVLKGAMQCHLPLCLLLSVSAKYLIPVQPLKFLEGRDMYALLYSSGLHCFCLHLMGTWKYLG